MSEGSPADVAVREGLFTVAADGSCHLLGGRCARCGEHHFPRTATCPYCSADEVTEVPLSETGTLFAWTAVTAPPPGYRGAVPFGFGVVELPEGIRVLTRLTEADLSQLTFGQPVCMQLVALHTDDDGRDVLTWAFG